MERRKFMRHAVAGTGGIFIASSALFSGCNAKGNKYANPVSDSTEHPEAGQTANEGQRYLFLDDHWIAGQSGVMRSFHAAVKEKGNPVIVKLEDENNIGPYMFWWGDKKPPCSAWFGSFDGSNYPVSFTTSGFLIIAWQNTLNFHRLKNSSLL